jgi:hypothetical protein
MKQVKILDWVIEFDKVSTEAFYAKLLTPSESCDCLYCLNFEKAVSNLPAELVDLLTMLGVDQNKAAEVYELYEIEKGLHLYGGWYHFVGRIVEGNDSFIELDDKTRQAEFQQLENDFYIGFTTNINLLAKEFPTPVLQIEFTGPLPWLLDEAP